jgi:hypothetical protein
MHPQISLSRAIAALVIGAIVGAFTWGLLVFVPGGRYEPSMLIGVALATLVWFAGLIVFAAPAWAFLHRRGLRRLSHAVILGLLLGFVVSFGLGTDGFGIFAEKAVGYSSEFFDGDGVTEKDGILTPHGWWVAAKASIIVAVASAVAAAVIWRVAYRTFAERTSKSSRKPKITLPF